MAVTEKSPLNAISVDVEDYFHVNAFANNIRPEQWDDFAPRVADNNLRLLDLFARYNVKGTFFVLGWVAERLPEIVKRIDEAGHEVASHGYSHQLIYKQTPELFSEETYRSKALLEDITGKACRGYRAASYSITNQSRWAFDILTEAGFEYDSSVFPVKHDVYGIPDFPKLPHRHTADNGRDIVEFPISSCDILGYSLPVAGGGYFRLYPYWFTKYCLGRINRSNNPFVFYLHPWEVDPKQPKVEGASLLSRFRHYNNLAKCEARLDKLIQDFRFSSLEQVLIEQKLLTER